MTERVRATLAMAETVAHVLAELHVRPAVIGAMALACHGYPRGTRDFDLATDTNPYHQLRQAEERLRAKGLDVTLNEPDGDDPLGGMLSVVGDDFDEVQVVNFQNPWRPGAGALGAAAIRSAVVHPSLGDNLPVVDLPHLIALKLYAGGRKSTNDVLELLARNPGIDLQVLRDLCEQFSLGKELALVLDEPM